MRSIDKLALAAAVSVATGCSEPPVPARTEAQTIVVPAVIPTVYVPKTPLTPRNCKDNASSLTDCNADVKNCISAREKDAAEFNKIVADQNQKTTELMAAVQRNHAEIDTNRSAAIILGVLMALAAIMALFQRGKLLRSAQSNEQLQRRLQQWQSTRAGQINHLKKICQDASSDLKVLISQVPASERAMLLSLAEKNEKLEKLLNEGKTDQAAELALEIKGAIEFIRETMKNPSSGHTNDNWESYIANHNIEPTWLMNGKLIDFFSYLGIQPVYTWSDDMAMQVKAAFKGKSTKTHPDLFISDPEAHKKSQEVFVTITIAKTVLTNRDSFEKYIGAYKYFYKK